MQNIGCLKKRCVQCDKVFQPEGLKQKCCGKLCALRYSARIRKTTKGFIISPKGYKFLWMPKHPMASKGGYLAEHRLLMATSIGRLLTDSEVVHHKNGVKNDNRIENLMLETSHDHNKRPKGKWYATCPHCRNSFPTKNNVHIMVCP